MATAVVLSSVVLIPTCASALEYDSPDPGSNQFGSAVAAQPVPSAGKHQIYIGDPGADVPIADSGALYIFDDQNTALIARILNPAPAESDGFGSSIAVWPKEQPGILAVGCPGKDSTQADSGCVYLIDAATQGLLRTIANPAPALARNFGQHIATFGQNAAAGFLAVGVPTYDASGMGSVYVFSLATGALTRQIVSPAPYAGEHFGQSVYERDGTLFVGAPGNRVSPSPANPPVALYAFDAYSGVLSFEFFARERDLQFGAAVASNGAVIAVGDPHIWDAQIGRTLWHSATFFYDATTRDVLSAISHWDVWGHIQPDSPQLGAAIAEGNRVFAVGDPYRCNVTVAHGGSLEVLSVINDPYGGGVSPTAIYGFGASLCAAGNNILIGEPDLLQGGLIRGKAHLVETPDAPVPSTPTGVDAEAISNAQVRVTWSDVAWDRGYHIFRRTGTEEPALVGTTAQSTTEFIDNSVRPVTKYYYTVQAFNALDVSGQSREAVAQTPALPRNMKRMIANPEPTTADAFGTALDVTGSNLLVGAPGYDTPFAENSGRAYQFSARTGAQVRTFSAPTPQPNAAFGHAVISGPSYTAVGAPFEDSSFGDEGAVYIFKTSNGEFVRRIANPYPADGDHFGYALARTGNTIAIGTPGALEANGGGTIYICDMRSGKITRTIVHGSGVGGESVAFGTRSKIASIDRGESAWSGDVYVFGSRGDVISSRHDAFSIDAQGSNFIIGTLHQASTSGWFAYQMDPDDGGAVASYPSPEFNVADQFGYSVASHRSSALVGAPGDHHAAGSGAYYVFDSSRGILKSRVDDPTPNPGDQFGCAIASSRYGIFVGAPGDSWNGPATGTVFVMSP